MPPTPMRRPTRYTVPGRSWPGLYSGEAIGCLRGGLPSIRAGPRAGASRAASRRCPSEGAMDLAPQAPEAGSQAPGDADVRGHDARGRHGRVKGELAVSEEAAGAPVDRQLERGRGREHVPPADAKPRD